MSTAESGVFVALSSGTVSKDCMYVIRPRGQASLYKLWIDDVILHNGDLLDVSLCLSLPVCLPVCRSDTASTCLLV